MADLQEPPQQQEADLSTAPTVTMPEASPRAFEPLNRAITERSQFRRHLSRTSTRGTHLSRTSTRATQKEMVRDPDLDINLPYRTFSPEANLAEYTEEHPSGEIAGPIGPDGQEYRLVTFAVGDPENPKNWSKAYKWFCTMVVALTCFSVAFASSVITADIASVEQEFNVSEEVALVSISVFVVGFGIGTIE